MLNPSYCLDVPKDFDDSEEDSQVHPMARKFFLGTSAAQVFSRAQAWVGEHDVRVIDVSWDHLSGEDEPLCLSVYFVFELPEEDEEDEG
ncbi:hypothetical protein ACIQVC_29570 [Streptomyces sp. NPDC101112]|uniref:hypothetical protein n=1 Tax=Streptomyces TaxID=1883 RepID=UPI000B08D34D|nr:hypothetical protein [Streptomyces torulosus]